ncbi:MAG: hypothetical protein OEZ43_05950 [Gammaproteobacteria bacterium]|nr:hypothetical protein [Gammaproteobacteria bacterium]
MHAVATVEENYATPSESSPIRSATIENALAIVWLKEEVNEQMREKAIAHVLNAPGVINVFFSLNRENLLNIEFDFNRIRFGNIISLVRNSFPQASIVGY